MTPAPILLLEDSKTQALQLSLAFEEKGLSVTSVETAEAALARLHRERPGLIIVDYHLPGMNGVDFCRQVRMRLATRSIPILMLTADEGEGIERVGLESGADAYLPKNTRFEILEMRARALLRQARSEIVLQEAPPANARVLIVDDSRTYLQFLQLQLEEDGYEIISTTSGQDAIRLVEAEKFDCVVLDLEMPEMSGIQLCEHLHRMRKQTDIFFGILMLTGHEAEEYMLDGLAAGADDFVTKSCEASIVRARIRASLRRSWLHTENRSISDQIARQEAELARARAERDKALLEQKNRRLSELYTAAQEFVDNVSHEFRTPLTVIKEYASILHEGLMGELSEDQKDLMDVILVRTDELNIMVTDMLDSSKLETGMFGIARRECGIGEIIERIRVILESRARAAEAKLDIAIDDGLPALYCDPEKIGRVITNLAVNAFKFTPQGGTVRLWVQNDPVGRQVMIGVTDDGPGIAPDQLASVFERFKQVGEPVRSSTKGFGLGLGIAKQLVHLNFGEIFVESGVDQGSTFSFTVPIADPTHLVERFLALIERQEAQHQIMLMSVAVDEAETPCVLDDIGSFLQAQTRASDLLFQVRPDRWLILGPASHEDDGHQIAERLEEARKTTSSHRLKGALPPFDMSLKGTWPIAAGAAVLDHFRHEIANSQGCELDA